jgi:2-polyprenyl-3-methyl-5-hydroxy-6-metoxy-1,4-benzoquinol methylase
MKTRFANIKRFLGNTRNYKPVFNPPIKYVLKNKWDIAGRIDTLFCPEKILDKYHLYINERILEIPFVHRRLDVPPGSRILDFGCTQSSLGIHLASRGLQVTGVDLRPYPYSCQNFTFYQGNFFELDLPEKSFDAVIAVSVVEHIGLGAYGETRREAETDDQLLDRFYKLLTPGGQLILTVPFGTWAITPFYRIYDEEALHKLLHHFVSECEEYYSRTDSVNWSRTTATDLSKKKWEPDGQGADGVALISARRPIRADE